MSFKYHVEIKKYRVKPDESYVRLNGWLFETTGQPVEYKAKVNGQEVPCRVKPIIRNDVKDKFKKKNTVLENCGFHIKIYLDHEIVPDSVELYVISGSESKCIFSNSAKAIMKIKDDSTMSYNIDHVIFDNGKMSILGWINSTNGADAVEAVIEDEEHHKIDYFTQKQARKDLVDVGLVEEADKICGFMYRFPYEENQTYLLTFSDGIKKKHLTLQPKEIMRRQKVTGGVKFLYHSMQFVNKKNVMKVGRYVKTNGVAGLKDYIINKVNHAGKPYKLWYEDNKPTAEELAQQKKVVFEYAPKISIIVPTYKTPINFLQEMIDSVINQSYANWELCIADGSEGDEAVEKELERYRQLDSRIKYKILEKNLGIAGNTNATLDLVTGEYIGLFDHDDLLAPNALYEVVKSLQDQKYDIIYTDEDKITGDGQEHMDPNFKPDFSMDLFRSHNYITHFFVMKTQIMQDIHGFNSEYDGSQDYDLMFRCIEHADSIKHIPMILYHWRIHMNSVAGDPASKMYAYEAGKRAIEDHLKRMNVEATVEHVGLWGMYHVKYATPGNPLISIIIPNKDHIADLDKCIQSVITKSVYHNFEIVIVENNSTEKETFAYYEQIQKEDDNISVVYWKGEFNYSAINNFGVKSAKGDYLLFLNNDTEMITPEALQEMLGICMQKEVGAVGGKLLFDDDTVQHAGVVIGFGGYAGHVNTNIRRDDYGYMVRARINCNYSAVTAACMMTKKSLFEEVGGFDEQFVVACNDVDYCLQLRKLNKSIVFNAFSEWYHYESKSRGYEDSKEKIERFDNEVLRFREKWEDILKEGDPYYNRNFPITQAPFTLG